MGKDRKILSRESAWNTGQTAKAALAIINGIVWMARSGALWRDLPERYGLWETVYTRFRELVDNSILVQIFRDLSIDADLQDLSLDSTSGKVH